MRPYEPRDSAGALSSCTQACLPWREKKMHAGHLAWLTCSCALVWLIWRVLHHYRLPRLPEQKLTRELIQHALLECTSPLVRLPASHGVLVTDPRLARKLLEGGHGAVRDVSDYARYRGFLDRSLVLLPQATATHATVCRTGLEPRTDRPQAGLLLTRVGLALSSCAPRCCRCSPSRAVRTMPRWSVAWRGSSSAWPSTWPHVAPYLSTASCR